MKILMQCLENFFKYEISQINTSNVGNKPIKPSGPTAPRALYGLLPPFSVFISYLDYYTKRVFATWNLSYMGMFILQGGGICTFHGMISKKIYNFLILFTRRY